MSEEQCDPDIFKNGVSLGFFDLSKERAETYCVAETQRTGIKHDWHYYSGRVHVLASRRPIATETKHEDD